MLLAASLIEFIIDNKIAVIAVIAFFVCIVIGFLADKRMHDEKEDGNPNSVNNENDKKMEELKDNNIAQKTDYANNELNQNIVSDVPNPTNEVIQTQNLVSESNSNINDTKASVNMSDSSWSNNGTISSDFFVPEDNNINNLF